jgi:CDGSH-type Zn-finger protein
MSEAQVTITPLKNGPNLVQGVVRVLGPDGQELPHKESFALCRCGGSANKPFCDGTHRRIGFQADGVDPAAAKSVGQ